MSDTFSVDSLREFLERKTDEFVIERMCWDIDYQIPIELISKYTKHIMKIFLVPNANRIPVFFKGNTFIPSHIPDKIQVNTMVCSATSKVIEQLLLHELNHWFTYETHGYDVLPHGKEFKKCACYIGLNYKFAKASVETEYFNIVQGKTFHIASCSQCNEIVYIAVREKTVKDKCNNPKFVSKCCRTPIIYVGTKLY